MRLILAVLCLAAMMLAIPSDQSAEAHMAIGNRYRQYYSSGNMKNRWHYYPDKKAYGINYYYQRTSGPKQMHYAYYYPNKGKYVYYKNPATGKYWGRCPFNVSPQNPYQILQPDDQQTSIDAINDKAFIKLTLNIQITVIIDGQRRKVTMSGPMPPIPGTAGTGDEEMMDPPPPSPD